MTQIKTILCSNSTIINFEFFKLIYLIYLKKKTKLKSLVKIERSNIEKKH